MLENCRWTLPQCLLFSCMLPPLLTTVISLNPPRKPSAALADPWPAPTILPALTQESDTGDYEAELAVVIGKDCKNVREDEALEYVLGYTACNDVSSRASQFAQSQWCFSKGFDGSCPIGEWDLAPM
jgi:2-keto-4-pentenoate hydratase/2-oxohepta-3-ene-1,7-dioic acid hydratase in catechol pathway